MNNEEEVTCPVCSKKFPNLGIDQHVEKCLFLNSTPREVSKPKPSVASIFNKKQEGSPAKKLKLQEKEPPEMKNPQSKENKQKKPLSMPLAEKIRPVTIEEFVGQEHLTADGKIFRTLLNQVDIPSMILWGPPGCGKTTLATIISKKCKENSQSLRFVTLSATMAGVNDIKEVVKIAKNEMQMKRKTILFMDEIHRFNKLQQDIFLPHVESGTIILIGATTENPSFSLNNALLSRCRVIVLEKLSVKNITQILMRALESCNVKVVSNSSDEPKTITEAAVEWLAEMCDGDARIALNTTQIAIKATTACITVENIKSSLEKSHMMYDKKGDEHYDIISALHKSIRASDDNAALYWVTRMIVGGEDPLYIGRRLVRAASEDIGLADPNALTLAISTMQGCQLLGMPECDVLLAQCAVYLARAPKSRAMDNSLSKCKQFIKEFKGPQPPVPLRLRNKTTKLTRELGYGNGYNMLEKSVTNISSMPEGLENMNFFKP